MTTAKELRDLTIEDLQRRAVEAKAGLFQDQLKMKTGALDKPTERTAHRRDLARILTVLTEKQKSEKKPAKKETQAK